MFLSFFNLLLELIDLFLECFHGFGLQLKLNLLFFGGILWLASMEIFSWSWGPLKGLIGASHH